MLAVDENIKEKFQELVDSITYELDEAPELQELVDSIAYDLDDAQELQAPEEVGMSIDAWKKTVIDTIPSGCSVKFKMDVEEMLENFKSIY